jgi:hypothetical protein
MCAWLWKRLSAEGRRLSAVVVQETHSARCIYRGR